MKRSVCGSVWLHLNANKGIFGVELGEQEKKLNLSERKTESREREKKNATYKTILIIYLRPYRQAVQRDNAESPFDQP